MKKFVIIVFVLCAVLCFVLPAHATDSLMGSVEIQVKFENTPVTGGDLVAVRVGYADLEAGVFRNVITDAEIIDIGKADTVTKLQNFYSSNKATYSFGSFETEIKNGIGKFTDVPMGLYLVYQKTPAPGFHVLPAFLVTVPYDGDMHVSIASKPELLRDPVPTTVPPTQPPSSGTDKLPQSGQLSWPIPWLAALGVSLFVFGWWQCFGRKEDF